VFGEKTITKLIDILKIAYGSRRTISDCYADLKYLQQDQKEDILHYIDRTRVLHQNIIEAETYEKGCITDAIISEINSKISIAFCLGLPIQLMLRHSDHSLPSELFIEAMKTRDYEERMHRSNKRNDRHPDYECSSRRTGNVDTMTREICDSQNQTKISIHREMVNANYKFCHHCKK